MITLREDREIDLAALITLRARCEFPAHTEAMLAAQLDGARWLVHAYDGDRLVGFARAISDGVTNAYVSSVMVDPDYRRRGIGRDMLERLIADRRTVRFVLHTRDTAAPFYAALGFVEWTHMLVRDRS